MSSLTIVDKIELVSAYGTNVSFAAYGDGDIYFLLTNDYRTNACDAIIRADRMAPVRKFLDKHAVIGRFDNIPLNSRFDVVRALMDASAEDFDALREHIKQVAPNLL